ncbi:MAG: RIP metalloprotease RseP [Patescibacteria group bacterium]
MSIIFLILGISALILIHELGHFIAAKSFGILVEEFGIGFPPRLIGKRFGETTYSINLLPFGGFVKIYGERPELEQGSVPPERSFARLAVWRRAIIIGAGIVMNFIIGWILISTVFFSGIPNAVVVTGVAENSPASLVGLTAGDRILGFETTSLFIEFVGEHRGQEIAFSIQRSGEEIPLKVIPRSVVPEGEGALGVSLADTGVERMPFFDSIGEGFMASFRIMKDVFGAIARFLISLFSGTPSGENFVGPVGIFQVAQQGADLGIVYFFQLLALISLNLAILNLLPIPALDGGRLLFLIVEAVKGSPVNPKRELTATAIGFILLILAMIAVTVRDVVRIFF